MSWADYAWFLGITSGLSVLLVGAAVVRIRSICTRDVVARRPSRILSRVGMGRLDPRRFLPGPRLDDNPVLWREWHRTRPTRLGRIVMTLYVGLAGVFSLGMILTKSPDVAGWVNGFQVFAGLLILSVTASTTLAEERVRGSLDVLMTTPISTAQIIWGKWLGTYRLVPALAVLPAVVALGGVWIRYQDVADRRVDRCLYSLRGRGRHELWSGHGDVVSPAGASRCSDRDDLHIDRGRLVVRGFDAVRPTWRRNGDGESVRVVGRRHVGVDPLAPGNAKPGLGDLLDACVWGIGNRPARDRAVKLRSINGPRH